MVVVVEVEVDKKKTEKTQTSLGQLLLDLVELGLVRALERDAAEPEVAELRVHGPAAGGRQLRERGLVCLERGQRVVQRARLRQPERERDALGLDLLDSGAQLRRVLDRLEVRHAAPRAAQAVSEALQGLHHLGPDARAVLGEGDRRGGLLELVERLPGLGEDRADARDDVLGLDAVEGREGRVLRGWGEGGVLEREER